MSVIAILVALLVVQASVGLTSVENARGLTPAGELAEATGQATTAQDLPITSAYHDNPISISGGGSICLYR